MEDENEQVPMEETTAETEENPEQFEEQVEEDTQPTQTIFSPGSRLLNLTESRKNDLRDREETKEKNKYKDDIWWEMRKTEKSLDVILEKKSPTKITAFSKLHVPTVATKKGQREKFPLDALKHGQSNISPVKDRPLKVNKIDASSPLLKPTKETINSKWNPKPPPPPAQPLQIFTAESSLGPKNVSSKLLKETINITNAKYKSKEQIAQEEAALLEQNKKHSEFKVKAPSERLLSFNKNLQHKATKKLVKAETDPRELGWNDKYIKGGIPDIDSVYPIPPKSSPKKSEGEKQQQ